MPLSVNKTDNKKAMSISISVTLSYGIGELKMENNAT